MSAARTFLAIFSRSRVLGAPGAVSVLPCTGPPRSPDPGQFRGRVDYPRVFASHWRKLGFELVDPGGQLGYGLEELAEHRVALGQYPPL